MNNLKNIIELEVARYFFGNRNIIVPNVIWALGLTHECDLLVLTNADYAYEVEIKISKQDIKKDLEKEHEHRNRILKGLYFAIPEKLENCIDLIPKKAGILVLKNNDEFYGIKKIRKPEINKAATSFSQEQRDKLYYLGYTRIWGLKEKLIEVNNPQ